MQPYNCCPEVSLKGLFLGPWPTRLFHNWCLPDQISPSPRSKLSQSFHHPILGVHLSNNPAQRSPHLWQRARDLSRHLAFMSSYSIKTDSPVKSQGENIIVGNEKVRWLLKKLGYQNHEQAPQSLPLPTSAGCIWKRILMCWIQSASQESKPSCWFCS